MEEEEQQKEVAAAKQVGLMILDAEVGLIWCKGAIAEQLCMPHAGCACWTL